MPEKLTPCFHVLLLDAEFLCSCPIICGGESGTFPGVIIRFSYSELEEATGKFSDEHLIGLGGSSRVYRGQLSDGKVVAVKKLRPLGGADEDFEFLSEVMRYCTAVQAPNAAIFLHIPLEFPDTSHV
jgi:hypothetical protein